ncbi:hypothetical protein HQ393_02240 [Chitinibacter bivalviorum]|uniref:Uncharacterized protein n=1 Tax=Chitinibacter bivalviorum TaxID=2739434 RepID=A0A7H9BEJ8_9NEIS|nr:hypothetical protein [Chitinibacter bivalviorum]QLG87160.1 hypothetical protein HQ393_02240 [Chitinibacter bivalviorum]
MAYRFRISATAFVQLQQLQVPMALIEYLAQPAWRGSAPMLSSRMLAQMPPSLRMMAQRFLGLYVTANGEGEVTSVQRMQHRLASAAQADHYGLVVNQQPGAAQHEINWRTPIGA